MLFRSEGDQRDDAVDAAEVLREDADSDRSDPREDHRDRQDAILECPENEPRRRENGKAEKDDRRVENRCGGGSDASIGPAYVIIGPSRIRHAFRTGSPRPGIRRSASIRSMRTRNASPGKRLLPLDRKSVV